MPLQAICRVCREVGETVNADCGHEVHLECCHVSGHEDDPLIVCTFCWHEPRTVVKRRESAQ